MNFDWGSMLVWGHAVATFLKYACVASNELLLGTWGRIGTEPGSMTYRPKRKALRKKQQLQIAFCGTVNRGSTGECGMSASRARGKRNALATPHPVHCCLPHLNVHGRAQGHALSDTRGKGQAPGRMGSPAREESCQPCQNANGHGGRAQFGKLVVHAGMYLSRLSQASSLS